MSSDDLEPCPACGGAGGGPFGRAGSAWDTEDYVCPRCKGAGVVSVRSESVKPGVTKVKVREAPAVPARKKAVS
jgi:DnaJ-class molecular chaperone